MGEKKEKITEIHMIDLNGKSSRPTIDHATASKDVSEPTTQRKSTTIISRNQHRRKWLARRKRFQIIKVTSVIIALVLVIFLIVVATKKTGEAPEPIETQPTTETTEPEPQVITVYFVGKDATEPTRLDVEAMTSAWAAEAGFSKRYNLTDEERWEVARTLEAEAGAEPFCGKMAVAQCILQAAEDDGITVIEVLDQYRYTDKRLDPSDETLLALSAVFDFGWVATSDPIKYFYAPALTEGEWHETQIYCLTIGGHKFFREEGSESGSIHIQKNNHDLAE